MKKKNLQGGFLPLIWIAIIAILAIGGGVYIAKKNKEAGTPQAPENAQENANVNANLGVNANVNAKSNTSLRALLGLRQNTMCTFSRTSSNVTSSGTVYVGSDGNMRGDFDSKSGTQAAISSHMIVKAGVTYAWTGTMGVKMNVPDIKANASADAQSKKYADLDAQGSYNCSAWTRDDSQFTLPSGVSFTDLNAMMKLNTGVKVPGGFGY